MQEELQPKRFVKVGNLGFPEQEVVSELELHDGSFVRKVVQTVLVDHRTLGRRVESMKVVEYRKSKKADPWPAEPHASISLSRDALTKFARFLLAHKDFMRIKRSTSYILTGTDGLAQLDTETIGVIAMFFKDPSRAGDLKTLMADGVISHLNAAINQARFKDAIEELRKMLLQSEHSEADYRKWFLSYPWVFGTEMTVLPDARRVGWDEEGDILARTSDNYVDLIELKLPTSVPLIRDESHDNWKPSADLSEALAQAAKYLQSSEDERRTLVMEEGLPFLKARARIVIGRSHEWTQQQHDALRRLNAVLHDIQIMTFDHLLATAERMVTIYEAR